MHSTTLRLEEKEIALRRALSSCGSVVIGFSGGVDSAFGKRLSEIELPPNSFISLMVKKSGVTLPTGRSVVEPEDELVAVTPTGDEQILYDILTGV